MPVGLEGWSGAGRRGLGKEALVSPVVVVASEGLVLPVEGRVRDRAGAMLVEGDNRPGLRCERRLGK